MERYFLYCGMKFSLTVVRDYCDNCIDYLYDLQWEMNDINSMYHYGDDGFCDGFTIY